MRVLRPDALSAAELTHGRLLDQCSLAVPVGVRLLLVAEPDEAGSALLRVLAGLARPRRGRVEMAGLADASPAGWARRVGYVGPEPGIRPWMTPREAVALATELLGLGAADADGRIDRALAWVRIGPDAAREPVRRGGLPLLQRTALASALVGDPEVLLLDEPLRAIDPEERRQVLRLPGRRTVVLASRYPASEDGVVTHVALLREGRIATITSVEGLARAGLPVSRRGIAAMADLRRHAAPAASNVPAAATR